MPGQPQNARIATLPTTARPHQSETRQLSSEPLIGRTRTHCLPLPIQTGQTEPKYSALALNTSFDGHNYER